jgi:hypothetical protein
MAQSDDTSVSISDTVGDDNGAADNDVVKAKFKAPLSMFGLHLINISCFSFTYSELSYIQLNNL